MSYNFRTVAGSSNYKAWNKWEAGDYLVGKYISAGEDSFGNANYKVEVIEAGFNSGDAPKPASIFTFNSSGTLNKAMDSISEGDIVKVIYKGEEILTKGKYKNKKFHSMEVLVAPANGSASTTTSDDEDLI